MVQGSEIPIDDYDKLSQLPSKPNQIQGNQWEVMDAEVENLLSLGVIEISQEEKNQVISPIFLVRKPDGSFRLILNLKEFNETVQYEHFKMENLNSASEMITPGCYMASVDLRHAYYSVPIKPTFRKYLKFRWRGQLYQYTCFANGLCNCPRFFTKLLKPVYGNLRSKGFLSAAFIDDCYLQGATFQECKENVQETVKLFESLGFIIHQEKSVLTPCKRIKYLGFWLDSERMSVTLPTDRAKKLINACRELKQRKAVTIRQLAQTIGQMVAAFPAVLWGPLFYRELEKEKAQAVKKNKGNFEASMSLSLKAVTELDWWITNVESSCYPLLKSDPEVELKTDASSSGGWGAVCSSHQTGGRWSKEEQKYHINVLELLAVEYGLKSFESMLQGKHVKVLSDNTCTVAYLKHMGGSHSPECNAVAKRIWLWVKNRDIWLTVSHIPGKENDEADMKSRQFNDRTEWKLESKIFEKITEKFFVPDIDLFASRLNFQIKPFVSWGPDPEAWAVDAFTLHWGGKLLYAFPPFSLLHRVLCKWQRDQAEGLLVAPLWTTAAWFPLMLNLLIQEPILLPRGKRVLHLPHNNSPHPLHQQLQLMVCNLSGDHCKTRGFRERLSKSCWHHGETPPKASTHPISPDGVHFATKGVNIPCRPL